MKFSVLMSVYNKEKVSNLKESLDSLLQQTLTPNEIILVEDGPLNEELYSCIEFYKKHYNVIKTVKIKNNVGLGKALDIGLKECKYDYVARMDTDDICEKDRFEKQISYLKENRDIDVLGGYISEFENDSDNVYAIKSVPLSTKDIMFYLKKRNPMNHVTVIFKKNSIIECGGYLDCLYFEDYYLWARMLKKGYKLENISDILVRVRSGLSMSGRRGSIDYIKHIINFEKKLLSLRIINYFMFANNILIRSLISLLPNKLRYIIYLKGLRNEKN